jgi:hypothetical protein
VSVNILHECKASILYTILFPIIFVCYFFLFFLLCFIVFLRGKIRHYKYGSLAKFFLHPLASLLYLVSLCILFLLSHSFLSFFNLFVSS